MLKSKIRSLIIRYCKNPMNKVIFPFAIGFRVYLYLLYFLCLGGNRYLIGFKQNPIKGRGILWYKFLISMPVLPFWGRNNCPFIFYWMLSTHLFGSVAMGGLGPKWFLLLQAKDYFSQHTCGFLGNKLNRHDTLFRLICHYSVIQRNSSL